MKKILFVNTNMCAGGIEISLANILKLIDYQKYDVTLLLCGPCLNMLDRIPPSCKIITVSENEDPVLVWINREIIRLYAKKRSIPEKALLRVLLRWKDMRYCHFIKGKMAKMGFDVAIAFRAGYIARLVAYGIHADKKIVFDHSSAIDKTFANERLCDRFDELITVSEGKRRQNIEAFPKSGERFKIIRNLVDPVRAGKNGGVLVG